MTSSQKLKLTTLEFWNREWLGQKVKEGQKLNKVAEDVVRTLLRPGSKVLELGSAPGTRLQYMAARLGFEAYGIDFASSSMIGFHSLNLVCSDIFSLPFYHPNFDLVCSFGLIEHFSRPKIVVLKHVELAKHRGIVLITVPNLGRFSVMREAYRVAGQWERIIPAHNLEIMKLERFKDCFRNAGLQEILCGFWSSLQLPSPPTPEIRRPMEKINALLRGFVVHSPILSSDLIFLGRKQ